MDLVVTTGVVAATAAAAYYAAVALFTVRFAIVAASTLALLLLLLLLVPLVSLSFIKSARRARQNQNGKCTLFSCYFIVNAALNVNLIFRISLDVIMCI